MFCCVCNGSCMHVGPHSYCSAHNPQPVGVCPNCGHCPTCGRSNARPWPWVTPFQPYTYPIRWTGDVYIGDPPGSISSGGTTWKPDFGVTVRY